MNEFLILLQAKLDEAKSKGNVNADIKELQNQLDKLKVQVDIDPKSIANITQQMSKLGIQVGQDFGKAFNNGLQSTINTNVLNQINKISDSSTSTIIQNEKKKQEAYKATSDTVVYHAGVISKLNKAETNGRFYGSNRGTGYFGTGHYFVDSKTKHELDNNSSYSKLPYTSVDISKYDNLFKATTDEIASKLHSFLENLTKFTQGSDRFNIDELFSQFKNVFTDTTMNIKDFGDKMEQLKSFMSNSNLSDRSDSVSTQFMKSLGYGGVDTRGTKFADTRYGTVIYDLKEESVLQANITDELQKQGQMLEKINYEKGQVFDSSADAKIQEQIDTQNRLLEIQEEFKKNYNRTNLDSSESELNAAQKRLTEIDSIIADCKNEIDHADEAAKRFARDMADLGLEVSDAEMKDWKQDTAASYQNRINELSLERAELEKRIPVLEENYNKESQLANEAYKQAEQIVDQRRLESQQSSVTANEVIQNEVKKQQSIQETIQLKSKLTDFNSEKISNGIEAVNDDGIINLEKSADKIRETYSELGKVTTQTVANIDNGISQIKVKVESTDGELKRAYSFLMDLSEDGKSFVFNDESLKYSENVVRKLNEQKDATDQITQAEEKLANEMADVREKSEQARQAEERRQELAQNKVTNKSLEDEYKQRQKLADKVHEIQLSSDVDTLTTKYQKFGVVSKEVEDNLKDLRLAKEAVLDSKNDENPSVKIEQYNEALKRTKASITELTTQEVSLSKRTAQMDGMRNWMLKNQNAVKLVGAEVDKLIKECETCDSIRFEGIKREFRELQTQAREAGKLGNSLWGGIKEQFAKFTQWFSVTSLVTNVLHFGRQVVDQVKEVNIAMVELTKVSDASTSEIKKYFNEAADSAKKYGSAVSDMINATADWSRLGYNLPDSKKLAEIATLYTNVGDGIDMNTANEHLISTLQGFQLEAEDALGIIDRFNEVANNFPIDTAGIGEALQRSAASFYAANTDLSKSIALITGTNSVVQDPDSVGTMWKTVSMRLRGVTQELEEAGLETEGMVESTAQLRDLIQGLTGFDIMADEAGTQFKDIYDIVVGIGHEWKNLTDVEQAGLLEALAGKRQGNALSAALNNINMIEEAYKTAENSAGSALEEQEKYEQGIEYSLKRLDAVFQTFANHILKSNFLKGIIDFGSGTIEVIDKVTSKLGSLGTIGLGAGLFAGLKNVGSPKMFGFSFV